MSDRTPADTASPEDRRTEEAAREICDRLQHEGVPADRIGAALFFEPDCLNGQTLFGAFAREDGRRTVFESIDAIAGEFLAAEADYAKTPDPA